MHPYYLFFIFIFVLIFYKNINNSFNSLTCEAFKKSKLSPLSNSEPDYNPTMWNRSENDIQKNNNCYAYTTDNLLLDRKKKPHPGQIAGIKSKSSDFICKTMTNNIFYDYPTAYKTDFETPCKCNYYKGNIVVDPTKDFHLYRQDSNGFWSHKPGSRRVTNKDASGNKIKNPDMANRKYKKYNYVDNCMYFCMPVNENKKKKCNG